MSIIGQYSWLKIKWPACIQTTGCDSLSSAGLEKAGVEISVENWHISLSMCRINSRFATRGE